MERYKITRATARTIAEWIELYEAKTKDKLDVPEGFTINFLETRGFAVWKADVKGNMLFIYHVCGDAKFWRDMGEMLCRQNGLRYISTICVRNVEAYIRFWNWEIQERHVVNGHKRFICKDQLGRCVVLTYKYNVIASGADAYWVTQYLVDGENPKFIKESE